MTVVICAGKKWIAINRCILHWCLYVLIAIPLTSKAQELQWVYPFGGPGSNTGFEVIRDHDNNIIYVGDFSGTAELDPGPGEDWHSSGNGDDAIVIKLDPEGRFIWARNFGSNNVTYIRDVVTDQQGNIYTIGVMVGTADFDPGPGIFQLTGKGEDDFFIHKLDARGNFKWAILLGDTEDDVAFGIDIDHEGQLYVSGYMNGTIDFDPGAGSLPLTANHNNGFIYKITPEGQPVWAKVMRNGNSCESNDITIDEDNNVLITGYFFYTADVDPGPGVFELEDNGGGDALVVKLNSNGDFVWGKSFSGDGAIHGLGIATDVQGNVIVTGTFADTADFDPGPGELKLKATGQSSDRFVCKLNSQGDFIWAQAFGGSGFDIGDAVALDPIGNIYHMGRFEGTVDFDPGPQVTQFASNGLQDFALVRLGPDGNFHWAMAAGGDKNDFALGANIADDGSILLTGSFTGTTDFDPTENIGSLPANTNSMAFLAKYVQQGVSGFLYHDADQSCSWDQAENGLRNLYGIIQPGNFIVKTNGSGKWHIDSLPAGQYTLMFDTSGYWFPTCQAVKSFEVVDPNILTIAPEMSFATTLLCAKSEISIQVFTNRPCEELTRIYVKACNASDATGTLVNAYVDIVLDSFLIPTDFSLDFEDLGENVYRVFLDDILPGDCIEFNIRAILDCNVVIGTSVCAQALLYPADTCMYVDEHTFTVPNPPACALTYDNSHLQASGWCENDSLFFLIVNEGAGDMQCSSAVKVFIDGDVILVDSINLGEGEDRLYVFAGDGRTWHLEVDQHPLHRGLSMPSVTLERCGNDENWRAGMFSLFEDDDADPVIDEFCSIVIASFDPNDKTGFPIGVGTSHRIMPNGEMDFVIRFQNTGTDTAYKVVIRDTLAESFDVFTVTQGASSHNGYFTISGPSVLEWVFHNILLPDSTTDLAGSNGFVSFSVRQKPDLPDGTILENAASIYFDYNDPVKTNTTSHLVDRNIKESTWIVSKEVDYEFCFPFSLNGIEYERTGKYYQLISGMAVPDTLLIVNASVLTEIEFTDVILEENAYLMSSALLATYQWYDCLHESIIPEETAQIFSPVASGEYAVIVTENGCTDTSACYAITIVSTKDNQVSPYRVYPNPSNGEFTIILPSNVFEGEFIVFDMMGTVIRQQKINGYQDLHFSIHQNSGLYFVQLKIDGKSDWLRIEKLSD